MKSKNALLHTLVCLFAVWALVPQAEAETSRTFRERLSVSDREIDRKAPMPSSYADVLDDIRASVVSISSNKIIRRFRSHDMMDELLREFYGMPSNPNRGRGQLERQQQGLGSGVLVTHDGYIITNNHVINGADEIVVTLPNQKRSFPAKLVATDPSTDVALIKIDGQNFPRATLADSSKIRVGDVVLAVGNPFELELTVTQGIISALGRSQIAAGNISYANFIQTDAPINPGNSGGALVDSQGRVIGINTMIYSSTGANMGIGFAIPINMALKTIASLLDHGEVTRGYLGVMLSPVDDTAARRAGRDDLSGAVISEVEPNSPADQAGLRNGDLIVEFEGQEVADYSKLRLLVGGADPGAEVTFGVYRGGRLVEVPVRLGKRLSDEELAQVPRSQAPRPPQPRPRVDEEEEEDGAGPVSAENEAPLPTPFFLDGLTLAPLDKEAKTKLGLAPEASGALVTKVDPKSPPGEAGLRVNDVIFDIGRNRVKGVQDARNVGAKVRGDSVIIGVLRDRQEEFLMVRRE